MKINSNSQYHAALAEIETFIEKGFSHLNKKETRHLKLVSLAVVAFEKKIPHARYHNYYCYPPVIHV